MRCSVLLSGKAITATNIRCHGDSEGGGLTATSGGVCLFCAHIFFQPPQHTEFLDNAGRAPGPGKAELLGQLFSCLELCAVMGSALQSSKGEAGRHTYTPKYCLCGSAESLLGRPESCMFLIGRHPSRTILCWVLLSWALGSLWLSAQSLGPVPTAWYFQMLP